MIMVLLKLNKSDIVRNMGIFKSFTKILKKQRPIIGGAIGFSFGSPFLGTALGTGIGSLV